MVIELLAVLSLDGIVLFWESLALPLPASRHLLIHSAARSQIEDVIVRFASWIEASTGSDGSSSLGAAFLSTASRELTREETSRLQSWWTLFSSRGVRFQSSDEYRWFAALAGMRGRRKRSNTSVNSTEHWILTLAEPMLQAVEADLDRVAHYRERLDASDDSMSDWDRRVTRFFSLEQDQPSSAGLMASLSTLLIDTSVVRWWTSCSARLSEGETRELREVVQNEVDSQLAAHRPLGELRRLLQNGD